MSNIISSDTKKCSYIWAHFQTKFLIFIFNELLKIKIGLHKKWEVAPKTRRLNLRAPYFSNEISIKIVAETLFLLWLVQDCSDSLKLQCSKTFTSVAISEMMSKKLKNSRLTLSETLWENFTNLNVCLKKIFLCCCSLIVQDSNFLSVIFDSICCSLY